MAKSSEGQKKPSEFKSFMKKRYRMLLQDEETLGTLGRFRGTTFTFLSLLLFSILIVSLLTISLVSFTPLRRLVPGYGDIEENAKYLQLKENLDEIEASMVVQETYIAGLRNMLSGERSDEIGIEGLRTDSNNLASEEGIKIISDSDMKDSRKNKGLTRYLFTAPVLGSISAGFDINTGHYGVDVLAAKGAPIKAVAFGVVVNSGWSLESGNMISIQHENNTITVYKHNSELLKKSGDHVKAGEVIAIIGNSGTLSDGPHLHFEMWHEGAPVNPENYITF